MNGTREIFVNNLKFYRKENNMTQLTLAVELEKGANYIAAIENGFSFPPPETIDQIALILGVSPSRLFDENASMENIRQNSRKEFAEEISARLEKRIVKAIRREVREALR